MKTLKDIENEIARVNAILETTQSEYLKRDCEKHLRRLEKEMKILRFKGANK